MLAGVLIQSTGALNLIEVHGPENQRYFVNTTQITSLRAPIDSDLKQFSRGTHCIIVTTAGKFLAVRETCEEVAALAPHPPR